MPTAASSEILTLSNMQAKELAGRLVTIGSETYYFKNYDQEHPGQPPWRSGAEGKAFPLLDYDRSIAAYMKFFTRPTRKRLDRTAWLINRQIFAWHPCLAAAPMIWADTRFAHRRGDVPFDFAGYVARAVPGKTWLEIKTAINDNSIIFTEELRWRCVYDLLVALAVLEKEDIVHGDLSPNNIIIDVEARHDQPALYLIDFDAFVAPAAGENRSVSMAEGGTYGTEGYCPPDLAAAAADGDGDIAPRSDCYGRDMLLMELLLMDCGLPTDDPPSHWNGDRLQRGYLAGRARGNSDCSPLWRHLDPASLFALAESDRPPSTELAAVLGLSPGVRACGSRPSLQLSRVRAFTPVVLGQPMPSVARKHLIRQWSPVRPGLLPLHAFVPWRWSRPAVDPADRTFWQDVRLVILVFLPALIILLIGLLRSFFGE